MERLTYFKDGYWRVNFSGVQYQADFVDRLAAYEDSRLSPEDAANLHAILRLGDGMTLMRLPDVQPLQAGKLTGNLPALYCGDSAQAPRELHLQGGRGLRECH